MQVSEQDLNYLRAQINSLRAAASRGSVSSGQIFTLTDPVMDMITRWPISAAQPVVKPLDLSNVLQHVLSLGLCCGKRDTRPCRSGVG